MGMALDRGEGGGWWSKVPMRGDGLKVVSYYELAPRRVDKKKVSCLRKTWLLVDKELKL